MSELAYNLEGDAIELPAAAQWWRVRRFRNPGQRGAPEVVLDREGAPVVLPIDASFVEFREAVGALPGRYRLDPLDDRRRVVPEVPAAYLTLNEVIRNGAGGGEGESGELSMMREMMRWNTELSRMQLDMAKGIADRFSGMMQAAAELIRAADGAGIVSRQPTPTPAVAESGSATDEDDDDENDAEGDKPTFAGLVAQILPMIQMWMEVRQAKAAATSGHGEAAVEKESGKDDAKTGDGGAAVEKAAPRNVAAPGPAQMAHVMAVYQKLTPKERAVAQATAAKLSEAERAEMLAELSKLSVDEAAVQVRALLNGTSPVYGGAS